MPSVRFRAICSIQSSFAELATPPISTSRVDRSMKDRTVNRCRPVHVHTSTVKKSVQCHTLQNVCDRRACDPDPLGPVETITLRRLSAVVDTNRILGFTGCEYYFMNSMSRLFSWQMNSMRSSSTPSRQLMRTVHGFV